MIIIKIPYFIIGVAAGAAWTLIIFVACIVISLAAMVVTMTFAPFTLFVRNANLSTVQSWVKGPLEWAVEKSSNLWRNLFRNLSEM